MTNYNKISTKTILNSEHVRESLARVEILKTLVEEDLEELIHLLETGSLEEIALYAKHNEFSSDAIELAIRISLFDVNKAEHQKIKKYSQNDAEILIEYDKYILNFAIEQEVENLVIALLRCGANVNVHDAYLTYPIHAASSRCCHETDQLVKIVKALVDFGANIHERDINEFTPLDLAVRAGNTNIVKYLFAIGGDSMNAYSRGQTLKFTGSPNKPVLNNIVYLNFAFNDIYKKLSSGTQLLLEGENVQNELLSLPSGNDNNELSVTKKETIRKKDSAPVTIRKFVAENLENVDHWTEKDIDEENINSFMSRFRNDKENANSLTNQDSGLVSIEYQQTMNFYVLILHKKLEIAIYNGSESEVTNLINNKMIDVNFIYREGITVLHLAAQMGHLKIMKILIEAGAKINILDDYNNTPIHIAILEKNYYAFEMLFEAGADFNTENPIYHNIFPNLLNNRILQYLFDKGINLDAKAESMGGNTLLHIAAKANKSIQVLKLIKLGVKLEIQNDDGNTPMQEAVSHCNQKTVNLLYDAGANFNTTNNKGNTNLHEASQSKCAPLISKFADLGLDLNAQNYNGDTALHLSVANSNYLETKTLINLGANIYLINDNGNTLLHEAAKKGCLTNKEKFKYKPELCTYILDKNYYISSIINLKEAPQTNRLRAMSCERKKISDSSESFQNKQKNDVFPDILSEFITQGIPIDAKNNQNNTALCTAIENSNYPEVKILLNLGSDIRSDCCSKLPGSFVLSLNNENITNIMLNVGVKFNSTDLSTAIINGWNLPDSLFNIGIDFNTYQDNHELTPLILSAYYRCSDIFKKLLKAGADPNMKCKSNFVTPLLAAIQSRQIEIVKAVIEAGAELNILLSNYTDFPIKNYLAAAFDYNSIEIFNLLIEKGEVFNPNDDGIKKMFLSAIWPNTVRIHYGPYKTSYDSMLKTLLNYGIKFSNNEILDLGENLGFILNKIWLLDGLIHNGFDINAQNQEGDTILHLFSANKVNLLLERGARGDIKNNKGFTALDNFKVYAAYEAMEISRHLHIPIINDISKALKGPDEQVVTTTTGELVSITNQVALLDNNKDHSVNQVVIQYSLSRLKSIESLGYFYECFIKHVLDFLKNSNQVNIDNRASVDVMLKAIDSLKKQVYNNDAIQSIEECEWKTLNLLGDVAYESDSLDGV